MVDVLNQNFSNLRKIFEEMLEYKNNEELNPSETNVKGGTLLFVALKHSSRNVKYKIKSGREQLHQEKAKVDINRLQLQNLLYEVNHLKREIVRCHKFKSRDTTIDLLPEEEYSNTIVIKSEEHSQHSKHLNRLECELNLRKQLSTQYKLLLSSKRELFEDILNKTERLSSFLPALRTLLKATTPLHNALQMSLDFEWKLGQTIQLLPKPLYLLYMNMQSFDITNFSVVTEIVGIENDVHMKEVATEHEQLQKLASSGTIEGCVSLVNTNSGQNRELTLLEPHPLMIRISIGNVDQNERLIIYVRLFEQLGFATAFAHTHLTEPNEINGELTPSQDILKHLYEDDMGTEYPIYGTEYKLQGLNITGTECLDQLEQQNFGRPYSWLQSMCSINTYSYSTQKVGVKLQNTTCEIIQKIRSRWSSWLELIKQIRALGNKDIDLCTLKENFYPAGLSCSLVQWSSITEEEFNANDSDVLHILPECTGMIYRYFRAVIVRASAKMECFIRISGNYPEDDPLWIVSVHWNGQHTSINNPAVKMMEYWTNSLSKTQLDNKLGLLYAQLFRTMHSFDIFLETEGSLHTLLEYNKEKPYITAFSKRNRTRPYKFINKGTVFAFKH